MRNTKWLHVALILIVVLSGCNCTTTDITHNSTPFPAVITVDHRTFSVTEIAHGVESAFHTELYYYSNGQLSFVLRKPIEYELYFSPNSVTSLPQVSVIITNAEHPLSSTESPKLYKFGVKITHHGLQSYFCEQSFVDPRKSREAFLPEGTQHLGNFSMYINEIAPPTHEKMSDNWKQSAEFAIRLYMDNNNFCTDVDENLKPGKYHVYIQGFSESDQDSTIVFVHENGQIYQGQYYFVHSISEGTPADLNHVELLENIDYEFTDYLNKLRLHAALHMEYFV